MKESSKQTSLPIGGDFIQITGVLWVLAQDKVFPHRRFRLRPDHLSLVMLKTFTKAEACIRQSLLSAKQI